MSDEKYAIRCWVNKGALAFSGGLIISDNQLSFNLNYPFRKTSPTPVTIGLFQYICAPYKYDSADYPFENIEDVQLRQWRSSMDGKITHQIKMTLNNHARGRKTEIDLTIDESDCEVNENATKIVYALIKEKTK